MPDYTPNLDLIKPLGSENFSVSHANGNADKIDAAFGDVDEKLEQIEVKLPHIYVDDYAKGDGLTNDTLAFQQISNIINEAGGGKIVFSSKTYIVGLQTLAGATGKGYAYRAEDILKIENCTHPVIIEGNGATIKAHDGLKFGSFDPITGDPYFPTMPFTSYDYRADAYTMLLFRNNGYVVVKDLQLFGNLPNITLGGEWGNSGRQCLATGLRLYTNKSVYVENIKTHYHALDGVSVWSSSSESDNKNPTILINVESEYNGRQGLSLTGGQGFTAINCKFNHTGKGGVSSSPSAGVDVEATNSIVRDVVFINCEMINNTGAGIVAESGDGSHITCKNCTFWGTSSTVIWANKPYMVFEDCKIYGRITRPYASDNPLEATKFLRCHIEDKNHPIYGHPTGIWLIDINANNVLFEDCLIVASYMRPLSTGGLQTREIFRRCKIICKFSDVEKSIQINLYGTVLEDVIIDDDYATTPTFNYFVNVNDVKVKGNLDMKGTSTSWASWSMGAGGAGGMLGVIGQSYTESIPHVGLHKRMRNNALYGITKLGTLNAIPTTGTWTKGDVAFNESPVAGGYVGWICTVSGTPGIWKGFGSIEN